MYNESYHTLLVLWASLIQTFVCKRMFISTIYVEYFSTGHYS